MAQSTHTEADAALPTTPTDSPPRVNAQWLSAQAQPERSLLAVATLAGFLAGLITIMQAGLLAAIVSGLVVDARPREDLLLWFVLFLISIPVRSAGLAARDYSGLRASLRIRRRLREKLARHVVSLGPAGTATLGTGRVTSALLDQVDALEGYYARFLPQMLLAILIPGSVLLVVFSQDWLAGALLLLAAPLIPLFMALVGMGAAAVNRSQFEALERLSGFFLDRLQGLETLRHLGRGEETVRDLIASSDSYRQRTMAVLRIAFLSSAVLEFFSSVAIATVAIYIGLGLLGYLTLGPAESLTLFSGLFILLLAPEVFAPLRDLAQHYHDRAAAVGAAEGIRHVLETPSPMATRNGNGQALITPPHITFQSVSARYAGQQKPVLEGIDAVFPSGQTSLITGPSGSGKSTLLLLILGLLERSAGDIQVGERSINDYAEGTLEASIGWLGQTPRLLPGSIADNIRLGQPDASMDHIQAAARAAGVLRFTDALPQGLDTPVGERSSGISGGEAQRVALARVLLRNPPLIILDEPTASLDPESREILLMALALITRDRTVIIATHQPDQFPWATQEIRLDHGQRQDDRDA